MKPRLSTPRKVALPRSGYCVQPLRVLVCRRGRLRVEIGGMGNNDRPSPIALGHKEVDVARSVRPIRAVSLFCSRHAPVIVHGSQIGREEADSLYVIVAMRILVESRKKLGVVVFHLFAAMRDVASPAYPLYVIGQR